MFRDPFRGGQQFFLVLCDTYHPDGTPLNNNYRPQAKALFDAHSEEEPWFGIEQEYFLMKTRNNNTMGLDVEPIPVGHNGHKLHGEQGQYYCSVGAENAFGRDIADAHMVACLHAGITLSGINAEVAPGQWEYQVGPCTGIQSADHVWMSRYLLERVSEKMGVRVCWDPKPLKGDWNGSGCHTNFSTKEMREGTEGKSGLVYINEAVERLSKVHTEHMAVYGSGNEERMTGVHETARFDVFTSGRADRGASVRIGNETAVNGKGYFEDRRPSSNMNPYLVTAKLFETCRMVSECVDIDLDETHSQSCTSQGSNVAVQANSEVESAYSDEQPGDLTNFS
jgi:glutamine synthetase